MPGFRPPSPLHTPDRNLPREPAATIPGIQFPISDPERARLGQGARIELVQQPPFLRVRQAPCQTVTSVFHTRRIKAE